MKFLIASCLVSYNLIFEFPIFNQQLCVYWISGDYLLSVVIPPTARFQLVLVR